MTSSSEGKSWDNVQYFDNIGDVQTWLSENKVRVRQLFLQSWLKYPAKWILVYEVHE